MGKWYRQAVQWGEGGPCVLTDPIGDNKGTFQVECSGTACALLGDPLLFGRSVAVGMRCTRLDVALDVESKQEGQAVGLVDSVHESCRAGLLESPRKWSPYLQFSNGGERLGATVYLGSRASDRVVRVYDKGLESGEKPAGEWERWEVESKGDYAAAIFGEAVRLVPEPERLASFLAGYALGAVAWADDERIGWYRELVQWAGGVRQVSLTRGKADWQSFRENARRAVGTKVATLAAAAGVPVAVVLADLFGDLEPTPGRVDGVVRDYLAHRACSDDIMGSSDG